MRLSSINLSADDPSAPVFDNVETADGIVTHKCCYVLAEDVCEIADDEHNTGWSIIKLRWSSSVIRVPFRATQMNRWLETSMKGKGQK